MFNYIKSHQEEYYKMLTYVLVLCFGVAIGYLYGLSSGADSDSITKSVDRAQELNQSTGDTIKSAQSELEQASDNIKSTDRAIKTSSELNSTAREQLSESSTILEQCSDTNSRAKQLIDSIIRGAEITEKEGQIK